jgi:hypothetical protein
VDGARGGIGHVCDKALVSLSVVADN